MADELAEEFPVAWCEKCHRDVLAYSDLDNSPNELHRCVECGEAVSAQIRHASRSEIEQYGYSLVEEGGCGNPDCGMGRCGRS